MNVSELVVAISVEAEKAIKGLDDTKKQITEVGDSAKNTGFSIRKHLDTAFDSLVKQALPIATVTGAMVALGKAQSELVAIGKQSEETGIPVEVLQTWGRAAESLGYSSEDAKASLIKLEGAMQEAALTHRGTMAQMLSDLGIKLTDANGKIKTSDQLLRDLSKKLSGMSRQKAFYLGKMLGISPDTIALLRQGKNLTEALAEAQKHVFNQEEIDRARAFDLAIGDLTTAGSDLAKNFFVAVAPALTTVLHALQPIAQLAADNPFATIATAGVMAFRTLSAAIMANPIGLAITAITLAIADFYNFLNDAPSMTGDFLKWIGLSTEKIESFKKGILDAYHAVVDFFSFDSKEASASGSASVVNSSSNTVNNRNSKAEIHNEFIINTSGNPNDIRKAIAAGVTDSANSFEGTIENYASGVAG